MDQTQYSSMPNKILADKIMKNIKDSLYTNSGNFSFENSYMMNGGRVLKKLYFII